MQEEDELMQRVMEETRERLRLFEESQRKWQEQQQSPQQMVNLPDFVQQVLSPSLPPSPLPLSLPPSLSLSLSPFLSLSLFLSLSPPSLPLLLSRLCLSDPCCYYS